MKGTPFQGSEIAHFLRFLALLVLCSLAVGPASHIHTVNPGQHLLLPVTNLAAIGEPALEIPVGGST